MATVTYIHIPYECIGSDCAKKKQQEEEVDEKMATITTITKHTHTMKRIIITNNRNDKNID